MSVKKYLRASQIVELTGLSRATIYAMEKKGDFPKKIPLGARAVAWIESEIEAWLDERKLAIKTGREAKPGVKPTTEPPRVSEDVSSVSVPSTTKGKNLSSKLRTPPASAKFSEAQDDGWGQNGTNPTEEEMAAVRAKLARGAKQSLGTRHRSGSATGASGSATTPIKGTRGKVTVFSGPLVKKKTP